MDARTPLAHVVAVLRRANPDADFTQLRRAAEDLRFGRVAPAAPEPSNGLMPEDVEGKRAEGEAPGVTGSLPVPATPSTAPVDERHPSRAEVTAWLATQKRSGLVMSKSGRIPAAVLVAWREAHREEILASMVPVVGGEPLPAEPPEPEAY
jgi:hypothetical protein